MLLFSISINIYCQKKVELSYDDLIVEEYKMKYGGYPDSETRRFFVIFENANTESGYEKRILDRTVSKYIAEESKAEIIYYDNKTKYLVKLLINGKWGLLNTKGEEILAFEYDTINYCAGKKDFPEGFIVSRDNKYGMLNCELEWLIEPKFEWVDRVRCYDFLAIKANGKYGAINEREEVVIPIIYDSISFYPDAYMRIYRNSKVGIITHFTNLTFSEIKYDELKFVSTYSHHISNNMAYTFNHIFSYRIGDEYGLLSNKSGEITETLSDTPFERFVEFHTSTMQVDLFDDYSGDAYLRFEKNKKIGLININAEIIFQPEYDSIQYEYNRKRIITKLGGTEKVYDVKVQNKKISLVLIE